MKRITFKKSLKTPRVFARVKSLFLTLNLKKLSQVMAVMAFVIGLVGAYLWYANMYMTTERRFWLAINNSMSTASVTRTLNQGGSGNQVVQDQQFFFAPQLASRSHVSFAQKSATVDTTVETEGVAFLDSQYSRYTAFNTNQKNKDGSTPSLDGLLGKWEGTIYAEENKETARENFVGELVTLAVFGNYEASLRNDIVSQLKQNDVYRIMNDSVFEKDVNGKTVLSVPVQVKLKPFAAQLQRAFVESGYGEVAALADGNYKDSAKINAEFLIDQKSNTIVGLNFGSREEAYSGYGITMVVEVPQTDYEAGELQKLVQDKLKEAF